MSKTEWRALSHKPDKDEDARQLDHVCIWPYGTQRHRSSCLYAALLQQQHKDAKAAQAEEMAIIAKGDVGKIQQVQKAIKQEFRCACSLEVTHLIIIVPCCYTRVNVPLLESPTGEDLSEIVHLHFAREKTSLFGTLILCNSCYEMYELEEGILRRIANARKLGWTDVIEKQWVGHLTQEQVLQIENPLEAIIR